MVASILTDIIKCKAEEVRAAKSRRSLAQLESGLAVGDPARGFAAALADRMARGQPAVIAEIKKFSPSAGLIRQDFDPASHARDYAAHGATCLSVLTDRQFFQGADEDLVQARAACRLPVLRKDFIIDPYQIAASRLLGADCVLLIVAALQPSQLHELMAYARAIPIDTLMEVHNGEELEQALQLDAELIGINNRDLHSFATSLDTTLELVKSIPEGRLVITESGIQQPQHVALMLDHGVSGFLVGESLMRARQPGEKLQALFAAHTRGHGSSGQIAG